jgi:hypothetical protein
MLAILSTLAALAAAHPSPSAAPAAQGAGDPHAGHSAGMSTAAAEPHEGCCVKTADGKMECRMMQGHGAKSAEPSRHQGHSGH